MNNRHNQPRYRFEETKPVIPQNETAEQRLRRRLQLANRMPSDNKAFLQVLRSMHQHRQ